MGLGAQGPTEAGRAPAVEAGGGEGACEARVVHGAKLAGLAPRLPAPEEVQAEAERFRVLGDVTRLRLLLALSLAELCVCDLTELLGISQTATSQHLKILRAYGLVRFRKQGRMAFYRLADPSLRPLLAGLRRQAGGAPEASGARSG